MIWFSLILAALFTLYIALVLPFLGSRRYQALKIDVAIDPAARSRYYLRNMLYKWPWLLVVGIILLLGLVPPAEIGLRMPDSWDLTLWLLLEVVIILVIAHFLYLRNLARVQRIGLLNLVFATRDLLPHTAHERRLWIPVSITAGVCEEIVFRGFLPWYFLVLGNSFGYQDFSLVALTLSTVLFGLLHLYQGWKGVVGTGLIGIVLLYCYISTGSLILPIIIHILLDARFVLLAPALLKVAPQDEGVPTSIA